MTSPLASSRSPLIAFILCLCLGFFGAHRFYLGQNKLGLFMLLTGGGLGIWVLIDAANFILRGLSDVDGNLCSFTQTWPNQKKWIGVLVSFLVVAVVEAYLIHVVMKLTDKGAAGVVYHQLKELQDGNLDKAYAFNSNLFQEAVPSSLFQSFVKDHPILSNYQKIADVKKIERSILAKVTFNLRQDQSLTPMQYALEKENDTWKVVSIEMGSPRAEGNTLAGLDEVLYLGPKYDAYTDKQYRYMVQYLSTWQSTVDNPESVTFNGKKGTPSYNTTISIQTKKTDKTGGAPINLNEYAEQSKKAVQEQFEDTTIVEEGEMVLLNDNAGYKGRFITFTYQDQRHELKRKQYMILRDDGLYFYVWTYDTTKEQYDTDLPINETMLASFTLS